MLNRRLTTLIPMTLLVALPALSGATGETAPVPAATAAPTPPPAPAMAPPPPPPPPAPEAPAGAPASAMPGPAATGESDQMEAFVQQAEERLKTMEQWLEQKAQQHATLREQSLEQKTQIKAEYEAQLKQALERQDEIAKQQDAMRKRAEERRAELQSEMQKLRSMTPEELRAYFIQKRQERKMEEGTDWTPPRRPGPRAMPPMGYGPMGRDGGPGRGYPSGYGPRGGESGPMGYGNPTMASPPRYGYGQSPMGERGGRWGYPPMGPGGN